MLIIIIIINNACIVCTVVGKKDFFDEVTSNSTCSLIHCLCLRHRLISQHKILKIYRNFLKGFVFGLKTVLGLVVPNQCCQAVMKGNRAGIRVIFWLEKPSSS